MENPFWEGRIVHLESIASWKNIRCHKDGTVDGKGGTEKESQWKIRLEGSNYEIVKFQNIEHTDRFLRINTRSCLDTGEEGDELCRFIILNQGKGIFVFSSFIKPEWQIGILPNGNFKVGTMSRLTQHAEITVREVNDLPQPPKPTNIPDLKIKNIILAGDQRRVNGKFYLENKKYGRMFAAKNDKSSRDHFVECPPKKSNNCASKFRWDVGGNGRFFVNSDYGQLFAHYNVKKGTDHVVCTRPGLTEYSGREFTWKLIENGDGYLRIVNMLYGQLFCSNDKKGRDHIVETDPKKAMGRDSSDKFLWRLEKIE